MVVVLSLAVLGLSGRVQNGTKTSAKTSAENPIVLILAHGLSETHAVHIVMAEFADKAEERINGRIQVRILLNGQLGSENKDMKQPVVGITSMTKVPAPGPTIYNESYHAFGLPYTFDDTEGSYHAMNSDPMQDFFLSPSDDGFVTLAYYTSSARSFYTKNKVIRMPVDLGGLKTRVWDMKSQTGMTKALGGIPVVMSYGDVYTSLQTDTIDGTENNETALTTGKHGGTCRVYSIDQHVMIPDVIIVSAKVRKTISSQGQNIILEAVCKSTGGRKIAWDVAIDEAIQKAEPQMGVEFVDDIDKNVFRQATNGMVDDYCTQRPGVKGLFDIIGLVE